MQAEWDLGQVSAGGVGIGLGPLPDQYDDPGYSGDAAKENWPNIITPETTYTEIYTRQYIKFAAGFFVDDTSPKKFHRLRILSEHKTAAEKIAMCDDVDDPFGCCTGFEEGATCVEDTVHPTAYQGLLWNQINTFPGALFYNSTANVDAEGRVIDTGNACSNVDDCVQQVWLPRVRGQTVIYKSWPSESEWICVEAHIELNTTGSADGTEEFWIDSEGGDDGEEGEGLHEVYMRGTYEAYGINQVVFGNYWNDGSSADGNILYRDNFVIATERIGCEVNYSIGGPTGVIANLRLN
jgi:hypothetical protein